MANKPEASVAVAAILAVLFCSAPVLSEAHELNEDDAGVCPIFGYEDSTGVPLYRLATQEDVDGFADVIGDDCYLLDGVLHIGLLENETVESGLSPVTDLGPLEQLEVIGALRIGNVPGLTNLDGLHNLRGDIQFISIKDAPNLQNIDALSNIDAIKDLDHGGLGVVVERTALKSLRPLTDAAAYGDFWDFIVRENPLLADCEWPQGGTSPQSPIIRDNLLGCNSVAEIIEFAGRDRHELKVTALPGGTVSLESLAPGLIMTSRGLETGAAVTDPLNAASDDELRHWGSIPVPDGHYLELEASPASGYASAAIDSDCFGGKQYFGGERWVISSMEGDCFFYASFQPDMAIDIDSVALHSSVCRAADYAAERELMRKEGGIQNAGMAPVEVLCPVPRLISPNSWRLVKALYSNALGRLPDRYFDSRVRQLSSDTPNPASLIRDFYLSPEFASRSLSNEAYIQSLYQVLLDRNGAQQGIEYWVNQLKMGNPRSLVLDNFLTSQEFVSRAEAFADVAPPGQTELEINFANNHPASNVPDSSCKVFNNSPGAASAGDSSKESVYFRVPSSALSSEPLPIFLGYESATALLDNYVLTCRLQPGVGITKLTLLEK
jgi:hypothetical protein